MKSFYDKPRAVLYVRKLGCFLKKLGIISNYYVDAKGHGQVVSIKKRERDDENLF